MTDPTGLSFLSYRRNRLADAVRLIGAQRDLGIPTWQDIHDLEEGHTDAQLREVLGEARIACAIAYVTPDVRDSVVITRTELPAILKRTEAGDGFFAVPVAAGGMNYGELAEAVGDYVGVHDLTQWNVLKVDSTPLSEEDAMRIARRALQDRLKAISRGRPTDPLLRLALHSRAQPAYSSGIALSLDWTHRFIGREASQDSWNNHLLPALGAIGADIRRFAPGRQIVATGLCALPAAVALGVTFLSTSGMTASWEQQTAGRTNQVWSLGQPARSSPLGMRISSADPAGDDIAVLVSVTTDVEPAFAASRMNLPKFRALLQMRPVGGFPLDLTDPGEAGAIARQLAEGLRSLRGQYQPRGTVHLFLAVPAGLAFLIGQSLNTFGAVQTYEHIAVDAVGRYRAAALLQPSA